MSKSATSTFSDDESASVKHDLTGDFGDRDELTIPSGTVDIVEVSGPSHKGKHKFVAFDEYYQRCFIVEYLEPPTDAKIKTETPGVFNTKKVFNLETYNPIGVRRIVTAWEDHAVKLYRWFL